MRRFHHKLVRDRIPDLIRATGNVCEIEVLSPAAYAEALRQKLVEEAQEFQQASSRDEMIQELADVREVLDALMAAYQYPESVVAEAQARKRQERGGFRQRFKLIWSAPSRDATSG